ncbi:hypothetical protein IEO21_10706 [Rhodonia placenta]|uniref:Uncharacterized protein n=1 Tax=Rhodonia placenta TaxID=104341 RepID=A0A8H7NS01_9APHY|nr:hypothetical protein IEO21_10706 [Postia placenta]
MAQQGLDQGFDGSWGDVGIQQPPQPAPPEAGVNPADAADRILFQAVAAVGRHQDAFANNQQLQSAALESLARSIDELRQRVSVTPTPSTSAGPRNIKVRDPRMFNGKSSEVIPFLREVRSYIELTNISSEKQKTTLFSMYLMKHLSFHSIPCTTSAHTGACLSAHPQVEHYVAYIMGSVRTSYSASYHYVSFFTNTTT